jgi:hypothetical protein
MVKALRERITFANHNLMSDGVFAEMNLVMCRNVIIYFDRNLKNRSLKLFSDSLVPRGFLVLGSQESIHSSDCNHEYESIESKERIYRRLAQALSKLLPALPEDYKIPVAIDLVFGSAAGVFHKSLGWTKPFHRKNRAVTNRVIKWINHCRNCWLSMISQIICMLYAEYLYPFTLKL